MKPLLAKPFSATKLPISIKPDPKYKVGDVCVTHSGAKYRINAIDRNDYHFTIIHSRHKHRIGMNQCAPYRSVDQVTQLDLETHGYGAPPIPIPEDTEKYAIKMPPQIVTIQQAIQHEIESQKPKHEGQALAWHKEGLCPHCGEAGRYHLSTPICSKHGAY